MMMNLFSEFSVDIWFCYGSFSYGFESKIHSWKEDVLFLELQSNHIDEARGLESFIDSIVEKPKGLLRIELRVFGPDRIFKKYQMNNPIYLYTDVVPKRLKKGELFPLLQFISVKGISPVNAENWIKLTQYMSYGQETGMPSRRERTYGRRNNF